MKADILALVEGGELQPTWFEFEDGFELLLKPSTAEEQRRVLVPKPGQSSVSDAKRTRYVLEHVIDWRGLERSDGTSVSFDRDGLRKLYDKRPDFNAWLWENVQDINSFRCEPRPHAVGGASRAGTAGEAGA